MSEISKVVVFEVGTEEYALPIQYVISIEKLGYVNPIPHLPHYVKGIIKVREELVPVLDFSSILYKKPTEQGENARLIVLKTDHLSVAMVVKEAKEILNIQPEQLKQLGLVAYNKTTYFSAVANLGNRLITVIDPATLVVSLEGVKEIQEYMKNHQQ